MNGDEPDRGSNSTPSFDTVFQAAGIRIVRTAVQAPCMNAICERLVGVTLRRELLCRVLILGDAHLRTVLAEYKVHDNTARPHQGVAQLIPDGEYEGGHLAVADLHRERIHRRPILNGLIKRILTRRLTSRRLTDHQAGPIFERDTVEEQRCRRPAG